LNDQECSADIGVEFEHHYMVEEAGCENSPDIYLYFWEVPLAIFAVFCFVILGIYLAASKRWVVPKFVGRSIFLLLLLPLHWKYHWGTCWKFFVFVNGVHLYRVFMTFCLAGGTLPSQDGYYGKRKYETRKKNARKAAIRKDRARRDKESRQNETKEKDRLRRNCQVFVSQAGYARQKNCDDERYFEIAARRRLRIARKRQIRFANRRLRVDGLFESQGGFEDTINFACDAPEKVTDSVGSLWLKFRDILDKFSLSEFSLPDIGKYWTLFRESDLFSDLNYLLRMLITLGFLDKIDISFKGMSLYISEPLRQKVTVTELVEKFFSFGKLFISRIALAFESGNADLFFRAEVKSAYEDEFTFIKSQKIHVDLGREAQIDDETFDRRVHECIETTLTFLDTCKPNEKYYYSNKLAILREIQSSRVLAKKEGIRVKPFGMLLFGKSGVGKSAIANAITRYVLQVNGYDASPRAVVSLNTEDKYQSEFSTFHEGVIFDDMCNTALDRTDGSPTSPLIMFLNNIPMAALNANAELKGMVMIEPKVVTVTTNIKDLHSNQLSNEPLSINRRFEVTITQRVRKEYCKEGTDMLDSKKVAHMAGQQFPDYALFTCEEPRYKDNTTGDKFKSGKTRSIEWKIMKFEGKEMKDIDIKTLLRFLKSLSNEHFEYQESFVAKQNAMEKIDMCKCGLPIDMCDCKLDSQAGFEAYDQVVNFLSEMELEFVEWANDCMQALILSQCGPAIIAFLMRNKLKKILRDTLPNYLTFLGVTLCVVSYNVWCSWFVLTAICYGRYLSDRYYAVREVEIAKLVNLPRPSQYLKRLCRRKKVKIVLLLVSLGLWKLFVAQARKWWNSNQNPVKIPTSQASKPVSIIKNMKPWQQMTEHWDTFARERQYRFGDAGISEKSRTITTENLTKLIGNKLMIVQKENGRFCNVVPLRSNVLLLPNHMVTSKTQYVTLTKLGGHMFKNMPLDSNVAKRIPGTDLAVWYCPGAGLHRDIIDYYPKDIDEGKKLECFTLFNNKGRIEQYPNMTATRRTVITTEGGMFNGLRYRFPVETEGGMCMSALIGNVKGQPFIAGHHLGGIGHTGAAGVVTRKQILDTISELDKSPGILVSHSAVPLETKSMGIEFGPLRAPHEKCPTNELECDAKVRIHGGHSLVTATKRSSGVVTSLISKNVSEIMGIEKIHDKPPNMGNIKHKRVDLDGKVDTATKFDSQLLQKSAVDYSLQLEAIPKSELVQVGKISDDVNLAGYDGALGFNAMNFATSVGFPGKGPKTQYVVKSERDVEGISCPRDVDPMILNEVAKMEKCLLAGESVNAIFKASLKDEPTKMTKDKVRVFAAANFPFTFLVRKYFLSLAALVQRNRIPTECAVGVVVQSPEWTELYEHIGRNGWDRAVAGDYAKFDGRMSPQFMLAAFKILLSLAERSGNYDVDDLIIMRGIATEISYPTYDYFGTILQFMGSNPSGHPMTVVVNSMVNSLYMRYVYYAIARDKRWWRVPPFKEACSLMTYGDDNIFTVAKSFDAFNHTAIAEKFSEVGITYTMADKEAESVPFITLDEASFLKHFARFDEEFQLYRSPVEEDSIAKMLHTHLKSETLNMKQSSAEAIQNVALKYFECGKDIYDMRVNQLEEVARKTGILGYVGPIMTYDERVAWYRKKFQL